MTAGPSARADASRAEPRPVPEELQALEREYLMPTYARLPVAFERGEGAWLFDA